MFGRLGIFATLILALQVSAQESMTQSVAKEDLSVLSETNKSGWTVSLVYTNLTEESAKANTSLTQNGSQIASFSSEVIDTTHASFYGVAVGYEKSLENRFGWNSAMNYFTRVNTSEVPYNTPIYKAEANLTYSLRSNLHVYGGVNVAYIDISAMPIPGGGTFTETLKPGGQLGLGFKSGSFLARVGYQMIRGTEKMQTKDASSGGTIIATEDYQEGGFSTQLGYTF